jgi:cysteate synthase
VSAPTPLKISQLRYDLICAVCTTHYWDDGSQLACRFGCAGFLQSHYLQSRFEPRPGSATLERYGAWLPGHTHHLTSPLPVLVTLPWLQKRFGIPQLSVVISGYWPRYGAALPTGSFKDLEADAVLARLRLAPEKIVALASAGNTALAFAAAATRAQRRCIIVVTAATRNALQLRAPVDSHVHFVTIDGAARYDDAITLSQLLADADDIVLEGGAKNIARRDGVAAAFLRAVEELGRMPKIYIQAVGSAAGALATVEAAYRLQAAGYDTPLPRLYLAQNAPFTPLTRSWHAGSRELLAEDDTTARTQIGQIAATVLSNTKPPYTAGAGIFEALAATHGKMAAVTNAAAERATVECFAHERILLDPAAAVAIGALEEFATELRGETEPVLLHITGAKPLIGAAPIKPVHEYRIAQSAISDPTAVKRLRETILAAAY